MKPLLPIVKEEIGFSLAHYIGARYDKEFVKTELSKIKKENPEIVSFIKKWSRLDKCSIHTAFCGILIYQLLRSQAESDKMNEELNL